MGNSPRILIVGGGHAGLHVALRLARRLRPDEAQVTVVDTSPYMTYQPLLAEAAAGDLEPRHVLVPLRQVLPGTHVVRARVRSIDHAHRVAHLDSGEGEPASIHYDQLVLAAGSISRTLPVPGLAEVGIGFKTIGEAIHLRNHVLERLDAAALSQDEAGRRRALTFVFVGGGYAGVEALAELADMTRDVRVRYPEIVAQEVRWVLVEASDRILPEVGLDMGRYTAGLLADQGIELHLSTRLQAADAGHLVLSDGTHLDADTLVWTAGVTPNPLTHASDLPRDQRGRVVTTATLAVAGAQDAWALGDCAAVPDLTAGPGTWCAPSAQHAVRQARVLADNIVATLRGRALTTYQHRSAGSVASLGLYRGVAQIYGVHMRGFLAWFTHRTYHLAKLPTLNRKLRVLADWTLGLLFRREVISLDVLEHPHSEFQAAIDLASSARAA